MLIFINYSSRRIGLNGIKEIMTIYPKILKVSIFEIETIAVAGVNGRGPSRTPASVFRWGGPPGKTLAKFGSLATL